MDLSYIPQAAYAAQDRDRDKLRDTAKISVVFFFCFYFFKVFCNSIFLHVFTVPSFLHFGKLICVHFVLFSVDILLALLYDSEASVKMSVPHGT